MSNTDQQKCQYIYMNLIDCQRRRAKNKISAAAYVREFDETRHCDYFYRFWNERADLKEKINKTDIQRYDRIMNYQETQNDENVASQACAHYHKWHEIQLHQSLSFPNWLYVSAIEPAERSLSAIWKASRPM